MKLTKQQAITEHRKMWRWIAEETEKRKQIVKKSEYLYIHGFNEFIACNCFCCEYEEQQCCKQQSNFPNCHFCPIDWNSAATSYMCKDLTDMDDDYGLFAEWEDAVEYGDWQTAAALARQIAELPEREIDM